MKIQTLAHMEQAAKAADLSWSVGNSGWLDFMLIRKALLGKKTKIKGVWRTTRWSTIDDEPNIQLESTMGDLVRWSYDYDSRMLVVYMNDGNSFNGADEGQRCFWEYTVTEEDQTLVFMIIKQFYQVLVEKAEFDINTEEAKARINRIQNKVQSYTRYLK